VAQDDLRQLEQLLPPPDDAPELPETRMAKLDILRSAASPQEGHARGSSAVEKLTNSSNSLRQAGQRYS
jgi:hypothetical protein